MSALLFPCNSRRLLMILLIAGCGVLLFSAPVFAAWNQPTCNPDAVGPTDPTCNVSAPVNVSSGGQTKDGALTITDVLSSGNLIVDGVYGGSGTAIFNSTSGVSLSVNHGSPTAKAMEITATTSDSGLEVLQNGSGRGISVFSQSHNAIVGTNTSNTDPTIWFRNYGTSKAIHGINTSSSEAAVFGKNTSATAYAGVEGCHGGNCGRLGTGAYGAEIDGRIINNSNTSGAYGALFDNASATGYALEAQHGSLTTSSIPTHSGLANTNSASAVRVAGDTGYGVVSYADGSASGAGVLGTATAGYGVIGWSNNNYAVYGNSEAPASYYGGKFCNQRTNCAYLGGSIYAGSFQGRVLVNNIVDISASISNDLLRVVNSQAGGGGIRSYTNNASLTPKINGTNVAIDGQTTTGNAIYAYAQNGTGLYAEGATRAAEFVGQSGGDGIMITADTGIGIDLNTTGGGTGIDVSATGAATGINVQMDDSNKYALEANNGKIHTAGSFEGGQFYPYQNSLPSVVDDSYGKVIFEVTGIGPSDVTFDGSDIWVAIGTGTRRYNAVDGRLVKIYPAGSIGDREILYVNTLSGGPVVYIFGTLARQYSIPLYGSTPTVPAAISGIGASERIEKAVFDGDSIWLSTNVGTIYDWDFEGTGLATTVLTGYSKDLLYADGAIWVINSGTDTLQRINTGTRAIDATYSFGLSNMGGYGAYEALTFDGANIWSTEYYSGKLARVNIESGDVEIIDVSSFATDVRHLYFDGAKIWMIAYSQRVVGYYDIAKDIVSAATDAIGAAPRASVFDGNNIWVVENSANKMQKISTGQSKGYGANPVTKGVYMWGQNGSMYCVYINGAGTLVNSTTLTNCQ